MQNNCMWVIVTGRHKKTLLASSFIILVETGTEHLKLVCQISNLWEQWIVAIILPNVRPWGIQCCYHLRRVHTSCWLPHWLLLSIWLMPFSLPSWPSEAFFFSLDDLKNCLPLCWGKRETKGAIDHEENCIPLLPILVCPWGPSPSKELDGSPVHH